MPGLHTGDVVYSNQHEHVISECTLTSFILYCYKILTALHAERDFDEFLNLLHFVEKFIIFLFLKQCLCWLPLNQYLVKYRQTLDFKRLMSKYTLLRKKRCDWIMVNEFRQEKET